MKKLSVKKYICLVLSLCLVWGAFALLCFMRHTEPTQYYDLQLDAAHKMQELMEEIKEESRKRGIVPSDLDFNGTGLIGPEDSPIVTTIGDAAAKRTSADPDMAALCVRIYKEAGLCEGDTVGICTTGSFPGFALASLAAADTLKLNVRCICSVGASTFGATNPEFTLPEMLIHLCNKGLLLQAPLAVTWGGEGDIGENMLGRVWGEDALLDAVEKRINALGYELNEKSDYLTNIAQKQALYSEIDCFISIGGHIAASGRLGQAYNLGEGLIKPRKLKISDSSGLIERYLNEGIPVISLVNVKKLCLSYGIPFDGEANKAPGESAIYYTRKIF